jgi:succinate dehydrogenase flavin-adding protein (antitoxin of CptAB toxin-antitoxin module)
MPNFDTLLDQEEQELLEIIQMELSIQTRQNLNILDLLRDRYTEVIL